MTVPSAQLSLERLDVRVASDARAHLQMQMLRIIAMNTKSF